jgi:hypothetical protein
VHLKPVTRSRSTQPPVDQRPSMVSDVVCLGTTSKFGPLPPIQTLPSTHIAHADGADDPSGNGTSRAVTPDQIVRRALAFTEALSPAGYRVVWVAVAAPGLSGTALEPFCCAAMINWVMILCGDIGHWVPDSRHSRCGSGGR